MRCLLPGLDLATPYCTQVAYREAITRPAEVDYTHKKQSGGSGQFARVKLNFVPADMDEEGATSDFEFVSEIKGGAVPKEYIPGVQKVGLWVFARTSLAFTGQC